MGYFCENILFCPLDKAGKVWYYVGVTTVLSCIIHLLQKGGAMFSIDLTSRIPIYEQIYDKIVSLVVSGTLKENDQLPSVRSLAKDTGVNPNTVAKAYQELERNGLIYSVPGRGSFIAKFDDSAFQEEAAEKFELAAAEAIRQGLPPDSLKDRIDRIYQQYRKENQQ